MPDFLSLRSKQCNLLCLPFQKCQEILTLFQNLSKVSRIRDTSFQVGGAPIKVCNSLINDVITFTAKEDFAVKAIIRNPKVLAAELAELTGVKQRQAQRIIAALKQKVGLFRDDGGKAGHGIFPRTDIVYPRALVTCYDKLAAATGKHRDTIKAYMKRLRTELHLIARSGSNKSGHWRISCKCVRRNNYD